MKTPDPWPQITYILCPPYHGATLLALLCNNHSRLSCLGDTNPSLTYDQVCACGRSIQTCEFWSRIARSLPAARCRRSQTLLPTVPSLVASGPLNRAAAGAFAVLSLLCGTWVWRPVRASLNEFLETYLAFCRLVCSLHGTAILVDGEKSLLKALVMRSLAGRRVRLIHLVRDPRGYLNSCRKYRRIPLEQCAREWCSAHRRMSAAGRLFFRHDYYRLRYEDLCRDPDGAMNGLFRFWGIDAEPVCRPARQTAKHHLMGNKMLFDFDGNVRLDTAWRENLSLPEQQSMLSRAAPLAARLGYLPD